MNRLAGELVTFETKDGLILRGMIARPNVKTSRIVIHIHGMHSSFHGDDFVDYIGNALVARGIAFFSINTRGENVVTGILKREGEKIKTEKHGTAYERFEDCSLDIEAAVHFAVSEGFTEIILQGHSTGCQKVAYYAAAASDTKIKGVILIAPVDDCNYEKFEKKERFNEAIELAKKLTKENPNAIMPNWVCEYERSAERYLSYADPASTEAKLFDYDGALELFTKIKCPILAVFGDKEEYAVKPVQKYFDILKSKTTSKRFSSLTVAGADHSFAKKEGELAEAVADWTAKIF